MKKYLIFLFVFLFFVSGALSISLHATQDTNVYYHASTGEKVIALTFDDGPHPSYTDRILDVLEQEGVKATFFVIGENVAAYPEVTRRVFGAGHEIGNHTYTHPLGGKAQLAELEAEIRKTDALLEKLGCPTVRLFRPPQGKYPAGLASCLQQSGKLTVLWNIDTRDWDKRTEAQIINEVETKVHGGDIVLFHDFVGGESATIPAIKKLIPALKERGYRFVTVSELLALYTAKSD